jgi:hypothetical protein
MEVLGIEPWEQEGKAIYFIKLCCHNSSDLCTAQNKETSEIDLVNESSKEIKQGNKRYRMNAKFMHELCSSLMHIPIYLDVMRCYNHVLHLFVGIFH